MASNGLSFINPLNKLIDDLALSTNQNELKRIKFYLNESSTSQEFVYLPACFFNADCRQLLIYLKNKYPDNFLYIYEELFRNLETKNGRKNTRKIMDYKVSHLCSTANVSIETGHGRPAKNQAHLWLTPHVPPPPYCEDVAQTHVKEVAVNPDVPSAYAPNNSVKRHPNSADGMFVRPTRKQPFSELQLDLRSDDHDEISLSERGINRIVCHSPVIVAAFRQVGRMFKWVEDSLT